MKSKIFGSTLGLLLVSTAQAQPFVGEPERLLVTGDVVGGVAITRLREGAIDDAGNVSSQPQGGEDGGLIVVTTNGVSTAIGQKGDTAPGGGLVEDFNDHTERDGDLVLYMAFALDDDIDNGMGDRAFLLRDLNESDPVELIRTNLTLVPGRAVPFTGLKTSEGYAMTGGRVALAASFEDGGPGEGVYIWDNGSLSKVIDTDESFGGAQFFAFEDAKLDVNGSGMVFTAFRDDGGSTIESIFLSDGGTLTELFFRGQPYPGTGSTITGLGNPDIDGGRVAIRVEGSGGEQGIFIADAMGNVTLVADLSTPLPDTPANTGPATSFRPEVGIRGSLVFFRGTRAVPEPDVFLWGNGVIEPVVVGGTQIDGFEVEAIDSSMERHSMSQNYLAVILEFSDGPDALYRIPLAQPTVAPPPGTNGPGLEAHPIPLPWVGAALIVLFLGFGSRALAQRRAFVNS